VSAPRPAVFLDRDGTVIQEAEYLADPEGVQLIDGAAEAIARLQEAGYAAVVVTNQSGIARGLYSEADYHAVAERVEAVLGREGVRLDGTYYCPHHPTHTGPCDCRKPGTGMHLRAARELGLELPASWCVGDKVADVLPAASWGGRSLLVRTGYGMSEEAGLPAGGVSVANLSVAVDVILSAPPPIR